MSEQPTDTSGPQMVVATPVMKRGPARISQIGSDITLPRPVRAVALVAMIIGGLLGSFAGLILGGMSSIIYGAMIFAGIGYALVTFSPLQGESFLKWAELTLGSHRRVNLTVDGRPVRVSVGICPVPRPARDELVVIAPGAVRVPPSQYDLRGVRISERNWNLDEAVASPQLDHLAPMAFPDMNPDPWSDTGFSPSPPRSTPPAGMRPDVDSVEYQNPDPWA